MTARTADLKTELMVFMDDSRMVIKENKINKMMDICKLLPGLFDFNKMIPLFPFVIQDSYQKK